MNGEASIIDITDGNGEEHETYVRSQSDHQLATRHQEERGHLKRTTQQTSASSAVFPVIYEVPSDADTAGITFAPPPSASSSGYSHQQHRRSTATGGFERQLSTLDPMSDRVSTILVWQDLIVSTREDKKKQFFQRFTSKNPEPKTKRLLHNLSGAITGGLWAVMGKLFFDIS